MARAPAPVSESGTGLGGTGILNFSQAVQSVASPGISRMPANAMPTRARRTAFDRSAIKMRTLIDSERHGEIDAEVGEIEQRRQPNDSAQSFVGPCRIHRADSIVSYVD